MSLHPKIPADGQVLPFPFDISLSVGEGTVSRSSVRQHPTHPVSTTATDLIAAFDQLACRMGSWRSGVDGKRGIEAASEQGRWRWRDGW